VFGRRFFGGREFGPSYWGDGSDTLGAVTGIGVSTNADDTVVARGVVTVLGQLAKTNADDTALGTGTVTAIVTGLAAYRNADDTVVARGDSGTAVVLATGSGGWFPSPRRRTRKELHAERVRLGILPAEVVIAAKRVAAKVIDEPAPLKTYKESKQEFDKQFLRELGAPVMTADYTNAIRAAIRVMQDEEDAILAMF